MEILDASSLMAMIRKENGGEKIAQLMSESKSDSTSVFMHAINYTEVIYKCRKLYGEKETNNILADLESPFLGIMHYLDTKLTLYAAYLKANYHLALGDAIGLAHTKIMNATFWTADTALKPIAAKEDISLQCIR